jgi:hypothetical protein
MKKLIRGFLIKPFCKYLKISASSNAQTPTNDHRTMNNGGNLIPPKKENLASITKP